MIFVFLVIFLLFVFWVWAIINCLTSRLSGHQKLFWLVIIIFFSLIGALLYFIFLKLKDRGKMKTKKFKGKRLLRSKNNKIIAGVCGGIGEYFNVDPVLIRLIWVIITLMGGAGILAYIIAWIIIPEGK
jgi:phage shock protein C